MMLLRSPTVNRPYEWEIPPQRDVHFKEADASSAAELALAGVVVIDDFFTDAEVEVMESTSRNLLTLFGPAQLGRKALSSVVQNQAKVPSFLRRKGVTVKPSLLTMPRPALKVVSRVEEVNREFFRHEPIKAIYGDSPNELNVALLNRTRRGEYFPVHQDNPRFRLLGYSGQTSRKFWEALASETIVDAEDFSFDTERGDLVVLRECFGEPGAGPTVQSSRTLEAYRLDGSLVHTGLNPSMTETSYTMNLFTTL